RLLLRRGRPREGARDRLRGLRGTVLRRRAGRAAHDPVRPARLRPRRLGTRRQHRHEPPPASRRALPRLHRGEGGAAGPDPHLRRRPRPPRHHGEHGPRRPAAHHRRELRAPGGAVRRDRREHPVALRDHARRARRRRAPPRLALGTGDHRAEPRRRRRAGDGLMAAHADASVTGAARRPVRLNLFAHACGHHSAAWRAPGSSVERLADITYWEELARIAERGRLDAVFLADGQSIGTAGVERGPAWMLEPLTALTAMARATERVGLVTTVSSTFWDPFHPARLLASLDHIWRGRTGVNDVTSLTDEDARNHSMTALPGHAPRYATAGEFLEVLQGLWESWPMDSSPAEPDGAYVDPALLRPPLHR